MNVDGRTANRVEPGIPIVREAGSSEGSCGTCLVWEFESPLRAVSSSLVGGGLGVVSWVLNATVDADYGRLDPELHLTELAGRLDLGGAGIAMMTAVDVAEFRRVTVEGVTACATVGIGNAVWAADLQGIDQPDRSDGPGTINLVACVPARLSDAALVNAVATVTEAKVQALVDRGVDGTGTASDALCVLCAQGGTAEPFGGPRSTWGSRLARAIYGAVVAGIDGQREENSKSPLQI